MINKLKNIKRPEDKKWGVGCAIINEDNKVLMGLRCKESDKSEWGFIGGSVEIGESVYDAVLREIKEECNLTALDIEFVNTSTYEEWTDFLFICREYTGKIKPKEDELSELGFFDILKLENMNIFPSTQQSINTLQQQNII